MPFKSSKQAAWAFANDEPWAEEWAQETPNMKNLPERAHKMARKKKITGKMPKGQHMMPNGKPMMDSDMKRGKGKKKSYAAWAEAIK